jgi:hypothetical protein
MTDVELMALMIVETWGQERCAGLLANDIPNASRDDVFAAIDETEPALRSMGSGGLSQGRAAPALIATVATAFPRSQPGRAIASAASRSGGAEGRQASLTGAAAMAFSRDKILEAWNAAVGCSKA